MTEPEEEENAFFFPKSTQRDSNIMDLDFDFDFDPDTSLLIEQSHSQNPFLTNPASLSASSSHNFLLQPFSSEQPSSPLWAFSDAGEDPCPRNANSWAGGPRLAECSTFLSCNPDSETGNPVNDEDKRSLLPVPLNLVPRENPDGCLIKERMMHALRYLKESTEHVLAQVWAPVKNGERYVLTTSGQPFVLDPHSNGLLQYRTVSMMYMFPVDGENDEDLGLPGRVFWQKLPEWTPNVQYYSSKEYRRLNHALHHNVRGTLALPVFEPSVQSCVGVLELIMTSQKINYAPEVDKICKALEAVNLKTSEVLDHPNMQICNEGRQNALAEILEILTLVCETHKFPLAQTWVPCMHRSVLANDGGVKKSCTSFDGSCMREVCMSTDVAFYVVDAHMWGFRDACAEHHLQKGQGVAGRAFSSHESCFVRDITQFSKTEYPLVHYARMFGLTSCFAICLRSAHTGSDDYVLEFFLPPNITDYREQKALLYTLLETMKQQFRSLTVASGKELEEERRSVEIIEKSADGKLNFKIECIQESPSAKSPMEHDVFPNTEEMVQPNPLEQCMADSYALKGKESLANADECDTSVILSDNKVINRPWERSHGKTDKSISLEVLQQYFAGSLKDAARSLDVCPTTMKRICRQHGISRWPSRKINKVNRSLSKLKHVIESVQVAEGAFSLISWPTSLNRPNQQPPCSKPTDQGGGERESPTHLTPESNGHGEAGDHIIDGSGLLAHREISHEQNEFVMEYCKSPSVSKTGSGSEEESTDTPTSHSSCEGCPANGTDLLNGQFISSIQEGVSVERSSALGFQLTDTNPPAANSVPASSITTLQQALLGGMLIEDAGRLKDLRNLCTQDVGTVTIKATYRVDIIRFRLSLTSGMDELKEEVVKRLELEDGTFDIKYLDDDHGWVLLTCDADLRECMDISRSSGQRLVRLLVHDIVSNLAALVRAQAIEFEPHCKAGKSNVPGW